MKKGQLLKRLLVSIIFLFVLTGCEDKKSLDGVEFQQYFETRDFTVFDVTSKVEAKNVEKGFIAVKNDETYQIEFYILKSLEDAKVNYHLNKQNFGDNGKEIDEYNYIKYYVLDDDYKLVERIDNTILYVNSKKEYKKEIDELIKGFGY